MLDIADLSLGIAGLAPGVAEVLAIEGGEEPRLGFAAVLELVPLLGPNHEGLLHEVRGPVRVFGQREPEAVKRLVMSIDEFFEFSHECRWDTSI